MLLNGGLAAWRSCGGGLSHTDGKKERGNFIPKPDPAKFADFQIVRSVQENDAVVLLNTLSPASFHKEAIPGSVNIPYTATYESRNSRRLLPADLLAQLFHESAIFRDRELIAYCGIGHTASQLYFVARLLDYPKVRLYDGSLADWKARDGRLVPGR
jgi:thiosulfate/3-mercaptopyruvate sulfurtransferase